MLADCDSDWVSRMKAGNDFGVTGANGLDSFGDSRFLKKHRQGVSKTTNRLVVDTGSF